MPLTAEEYELYKANPKALKEELLIVDKDGYRTVDQREDSTTIDRRPPPGNGGAGLQAATKAKENDKKPKNNDVLVKAAKMRAQGR